VIKSIERLFEYFSDRFSAVFVRYAKKRWKLRLIALTVFILAIVLLLGWMSSKKVREVVVQDFNLQQLVLARHAARQTENFLHIIEREMHLLSQHPFFQTPEPSFLKWQMLLSYSLLADEGLAEIRFFDAAGNRTYRVIPNGGGFSTGGPSAADLELLDSTRQLYGDNIFHFSSRHSAMPETKGRRTLLYIAKPIYASPGATKRVREASRLRGVLIYVVDAMTVAERTLRDIRSGKTGYAWMIDSNGDFLYHHESSFIGRNAFEARKEKDPSLSYMLIEDIQRKKMLKGEEGTGWYMSGWHLGVQGNIKKLIAFSPISIAAAPDSLVWSVAVVAPMSEVEGAIEAIQVRQYLLEGIIIIFVLLGSFLTFTAMAKWSSTLKDEVRRKTDELLQSENQYASLVEHASDIIYTVDRNADFLTINKAGTEFFKKDKKDIIGHNIGTICFNEEGASRQFKAINEVFATGESREIVYSLNINNAEIWVSTSYSLTAGKSGSSAVLGIARDVTERKRREEQMYHTEKLASLGTLAAGVAHEINNPLAIILGFADMLLGKTPPESEAYDILKTIEKQGNNAKRVVENLLSFARYRESREELIDINANIEDVLMVAGNTLRLSKVVVQKRLANDLPAIKGDSREIQQVFLNIINNAIYAMKGHGILTVTTGTTANGDVEIRLSDTGHGIKKEDRNKIFDPLFTTKEVGEGTGLGLSVCYAIVAKYGGTITFETRTADETPEAIGHVNLDDLSTIVDLSADNGKPLTGTTFIITLPVVRD
jgi:PAS domain S-box-containing protein